MEKDKIIKLVLGIISIILGIIMLVSKNSIIVPILIACGIILIVSGVYKIVLAFGIKGPGILISSFTLPTGIFFVLLGFILALIPGFVLTSLNVFLSIFLIIYALSKAIMTYNFKRLGLKTHWISYIISAIWLILGILIMLTPWFTAITIDILLAITLILFGINSLINLKDKNKGSKNPNNIIIDAK